ncbi:MAG: hypothetical protein AB1486_33915 [Planctomycetota bacterium]
MRRSPIRVTVVLLLAATQVSMGGFGRLGVLCYGADGHVAFEADPSQCCAVPLADQSARAALPESVPVASFSDSRPCGLCLDVTLQVSTSGPQPRQPCNAAVALAPTIPFTLPWPPRAMVRLPSTGDCRVESLRATQAVLRI